MRQNSAKPGLGIETDEIDYPRSGQSDRQNSAKPGLGIETIA